MSEQAQNSKEEDKSFWEYVGSLYAIVVWLFYTMSSLWLPNYIIVPLDHGFWTGILLLMLWGWFLMGNICLIMFVSEFFKKRKLSNEKNDESPS